MKTRTVELTLRVTFQEDDGSLPDEHKCFEQLEALVSYAANRGLISGESSLEVASYDHTVRSIHTSSPS